MFTLGNPDPSALLPEKLLDKQVLTVSQLNSRARELLEATFASVWVEGEISNVSTPASGHWYFTLKDSAAQIRCAMFRNRNIFSRCKPEAGKKVAVRGRISLFEGRGDYQLIADQMDAAGEGDLQRQFERMKARLQLEGIFDSQHKKPLPRWPGTVAVVTSATGAAVQDICQVLKRRFPALRVVVLPVAVQGEQAAPQVAAAIARVNDEHIADVIIVGRGGGSLEDLWAFNEEIVARAIFASVIPVVSAVGHETDFSIADFVADVRAPTPSAAAELISPDQNEISARLVHIERRLLRAIRTELDQARQALQIRQARMLHPRHRLQALMQQVDYLEVRLRRAMQAGLQRRRAHLDGRAAALARCAPSDLLRRYRQRHDYLAERLRGSMTRILQRRAERLGASSQMLNTVSPLQTVARGYAIVTDKSGGIVRDSTQLQTGDTITARLARGELTCDVIRIKHVNDQ